MSKTPKTPSSTTRLIALETRQAELEKRIAELERAANRQMPIPWTAPMDQTYPAYPQFPTPIGEPSCHVCGNKWKDMTHYICSNDRCPNRVWCGDSLPGSGPSFTCRATTTQSTSASTNPVA